MEAVIAITSMTVPLYKSWASHEQNRCVPNRDSYCITQNRCVVPESCPNTHSRRFYPQLSTLVHFSVQGGDEIRSYLSQAAFSSGPKPNIIKHICVSVTSHKHTFNPHLARTNIQNITMLKRSSTRQRLRLDILRNVITHMQYKSKVCTLLELLVNITIIQFSHFKCYLKI